MSCKLTECVWKESVNGVKKTEVKVGGLINHGLERNAIGSRVGARRAENGESRDIICEVEVSVLRSASRDDDQFLRLDTSKGAGSYVCTEMKCTSVPNWFQISGAQHSHLAIGEDGGK